MAAPPVTHIVVQGYAATVYLYADSLAVAGAGGDRVDVAVASCRSSSVAALPTRRGLGTDVQLNLVVRFDGAASAAEGDATVRIVVVCPPEAAPAAVALHEVLRAHREGTREWKGRSEPAFPLTSADASVTPLPRRPGSQESPAVRRRGDTLPRLVHRAVPDTADWLSFRPLASSADVLAPSTDDT